MYLSQPCDLITSMSAGCSRSSVLLARPSDSPRRPPSPHAHGSPELYLHSSPEQHHVRRQYNAPSGHLQLSPGRSEDAKPGTLLTAVPGSESRSMSRWFRAQHFQSVWDNLDCGNPESRPPHPYTELIKLCILKRREGKLTLNQLYRDLEEKFPFFAGTSKGKGWKNTLRHNLSTQPYFIKLDREHGQLGKGHYWAYCPDLEKPTSLAQSSVVQLSTLWPPSVSAASVPPTNDSARRRSSPNSFTHDQDERLPWYDSHDRRPRSYRDVPPNCPENDVRRSTPMPTTSRPVSSPARYFLSLRYGDNDDKHPGHLRSRSATFSTISRNSADASRNYRERVERRSSTFWAPSSSSLSPLSEFDRDHEEVVLARPELPVLPRTPARKSLGDYYLSNPISTTRKSFSMSSRRSSAASPY